jgi:hypothetical protein
MRFFMSCDGEAKQIEVFQEQEILDLFKEALIDFAKTPASCSAICQASDASPYFKATKKRLRHQSIGFNPVQDDENENTIDQLKLALGERFASNKKGVIIKSLLKVVEAIRDTLTSSIVKTGYRVTGQWPIDFTSAMNQCSAVSQLSAAAYIHMRDKVETLAGIFRERGVLTEADMDEHGIVDLTDDTRKTPKDQRVLHQQRAVLMNSEECIRQFKEYQARLEARKAAVRQSATDGQAQGLTNAQLYEAWFNRLTKDEQREELVLRDAAGGKVARRKQKAAELRVQGWKPDEPVEEIVA